MVIHLEWKRCATYGCDNEVAPKHEDANVEKCSLCWKGQWNDESWVWRTPSMMIWHGQKWVGRKHVFILSEEIDGWRIKGCERDPHRYYSDAPRTTDEMLNHIEMCQWVLSEDENESWTLRGAL